MTNPYSTALRVLLAAPGAVDAVYTPAAGPAVPLRAIENRESAILGLPGGSHSVGDGNTYVIHAEDYPSQPKRGDVLSIARGDLKVLADGKLDAEGVGWLIQAG